MMRVCGHLVGIMHHKSIIRRAQSAPRLGFELMVLLEFGIQQEYTIAIHLTPIYPEVFSNNSQCAGVILLSIIHEA
jgi:hypothetical protein